MLTAKQQRFRDDLVYEYRALTRGEFGNPVEPNVDLDGDNVVTVLQDLVNDFRDDHPTAHQTVPLSIGFTRPDRPTF